MNVTVQNKSFDNNKKIELIKSHSHGTTVRQRDDADDDADDDAADDDAKG